MGRRELSNTIGIDVGGTKIAGGVVDDDGHLIAELRRESPAAHPDAIAATIADMVGELRADDEVRAVGVAAAGFIDLARETIMFAPNLAWRDESLRKKVADLVDLPTLLENDANAAAWAEARFGSGQDARTLVMAAIGTGIGGGLVSGGRLFRGGFGVGAEFGHMRVVPDGRPCACGLRGCWEAYGSGTGLTVRARELAAEDRAGASLLLSLGDGDPSSITGPMVTEAAEKGDPVAVRCFDELADWIGAGLASLAAVLDPDVIVVGGGVSESPALSLERVAAAFAAAETGAGFRPSPAIRLAALGNKAGLIGVADLAREQA
jgi:glucokinase